jgi:hypothetical protein
MTQHRQIIRGVSALILISAGVTWAADQAPTPDPKEPLKLLPPQPLVPNAKVVTLWPAGSPMLKPLDGWDKPEVLNRNKTRPERVDSVTNIHNPSIEVHLAPPDKATGMAVIVAPGGGNTTCVAGTEGVDIADWLNGLGIHAFIERYRLRPYGSQTDALADTQRSFRIIRANAKEWAVDPKRVGIMGFSAGGEQAALAVLHFDEGKADAADPIDRLSCRPDFTVLVYAGWRNLDLSQVSERCPAGVFGQCRARGRIARETDGRVLRRVLSGEGAGRTTHLRSRRARRRDWLAKGHPLRDLAPPLPRLGKGPGVHDGSGREIRPLARLDLGLRAQRREREGAVPAARHRMGMEGVFAEVGQRGPVMWSAGGSLAVLVGALLFAVGVISATINNDPGSYLHSEHGGWAVRSGLVVMAAGGGLIIVSRLFGPRKTRR